MSVFARDGNYVFHTYSAYSRGFDGLWTMWQWLDRAPLGRNKATCHGSIGTTSTPRPQSNRHDTRTYPPGNQ